MNKTIIVKWNKFPDVEPQDGEQVAVRECTADNPYECQNCKVCIYCKDKKHFWWMDGDQDGEIKPFKGYTIYWMFLPMCPCKRNE